jgi:hypothetical protein
MPPAGYEQALAWFLLVVIAWLALYFYDPD